MNHIQVRLTDCDTFPEPTYCCLDSEEMTPTHRDTRLV